MKTSATVKDELISMWQDGKSPKKLSILFNVAQSTIYRWVDGVELSGKRKELHEKKLRVIALRTSGKSAKEISDVLDVPKGTVGHWIEGVELSLEQRNRLSAVRLKKSREGCRKGSAINAAKAKERHHRWFLDGHKWALESDVFRIICALYWGEGGKTRKCFAFSNSDPDMLKLVTKWLVSEGYEYRFQLRYHSDKNPDELLVFWKKCLENLTDDRIFKSQVKASKKNSRQMPYACGQVSVGSTELFFKVMGGIDYLKTASLQTGKIVV